MNNAAVLQHSVAIERQQFVMIQGRSDSHAALTGLGTCTAEVHRSLLHLHEELNVGRVINLLTYPWLWMNGCVPVGMLKALGATLCCATCGIVAYGKASYTTQSKNTEWTELISPGSFLVLSTPELYCSSNLRCEDEDMSYSHSYRHSISWKTLCTGKITASCNIMGMQDMKWLPQSYCGGRA